MTFKKSMMTAATALSLSAGAASADNFLKYDEVEDWKIFVDQERKSCLIEKQFDSGEVVQMGLTQDRGVGYVGVFTDEETDIKQGEKQLVAIALGENIYIGEAAGLRGSITKGYSGGYVLSEDPQFVTDIAQQYEMVVFPETSFAFVVDLTGTKKAIEMARTCNQEQLG